MRRCLIVHRLELNWQCVHEREEGTSQEENVAEVRKNGLVLEEICLHHGLTAHSPFVEYEAEHEGHKADKTPDDACTGPRVYTTPMHSKDETGERAGKKDGAVEVQVTELLGKRRYFWLIRVLKA